MTFLIAAVDAPNKIKKRADYVCQGQDDQEQFEAAINKLPANGGKLQASEGSFNGDFSELFGDKPIWLQGAGWGATKFHCVDSQNEGFITVTSMRHKLSDFGVVCIGDVARWGIWVDHNSARNTMRDLQVEDAPTLGAGIRLDTSSSQIVMDNIRALNSGGVGFDDLSGSNVGTALFALGGPSGQISAGPGFKLRGNSLQYTGLISTRHAVGLEINSYAHAIAVDGIAIEDCPEIGINIRDDVKVTPSSISIKNYLITGSKIPLQIKRIRGSHIEGEIRD